MGFEDFVRARSAALYRLAFLLTGQRAEAEDLLQTTLVGLFVHWRRASRATSVEAYARRALVNTFVSGRRPARWHRERLVDAVPETTPARSAGAADDATAAVERLALWPHVQALPPRQRAVVVLRYLGDLSEAEIADALGCAPGTVKSTASAALRTLRERLGEEWGDDD